MGKLTGNWIFKEYGHLIGLASFRNSQNYGHNIKAFWEVAIQEINHSM